MPTGGPPPVPSSAAIVSVGNELLFGQTIDSNAAWLGRRFADRGIPVVRRLTVGDVDSEIAWALDQAMATAPLVIVMGGLGPTPDDRTKAAVAGHLGLSLVADADVARTLRRRYASAGLDDVPVSSLGQADVLEGALVLANPAGTAPGLLVETDVARIVLLPGVPREVEAIVLGALEPALDRIAPVSARIHHRVVHTTGIPESRLSELLEARLDELPGSRKHVSIAYLPDALGVDLRLTVHASTEVDADAHFERVLKGVMPVLAPWSFEALSGDLAEAVSVALRRRQWTMAVAESCTGGLVAKRMTDLPGASSVFLGGMVVYSNDAKAKLAGVSPSDLEREGAVSEAVACQLALGAATRLQADTGIGVTGVAGPGGGSDAKPVGTVWIATSVRGRVLAELQRVPGDRGAVRARSAQLALAALYRRLTTEAEG